MKKTAKLLMYFAAAAMTFVSCGKEEIKPVEPETPGVIRVRFGAEAAITKAVTTEDDANFESTWIDGDEVSITTYLGGAAVDSRVEATWIDDGFYADFDASKYSSDQTYQLKGVYPYSADGNVNFGNTRDQVGAKHSSEYDIMVSSVINSSMPSSRDNIILPMARQTATVYFHLTSGFDEIVKSVTLVTDEGKPISAVSATLDTENGFVPTTGEGCNYITLNIKEDGANVMHTTDMQFWFNVLPVAETSLKLIVESENRTFTMNKKANTTSWKAGHLYSTVLEGIPADKWVEKPATTNSITITKATSGISGSYGTSSFTQDGVSFAYTDWMIKSGSENIQAKASTSNSLYNTTAIPGKIRSITFNQISTPRAITVKAGTSVIGGESGTPGTGITAPSTGASMKFDFSGGSYNYFSMNTPNNATYFTSIVIEYDTTFDPLNPNFSIKVPDGETSHGTVALKNSADQSITYAKAGEIVKLTAVPNTGYALTEGTLVAKNSVTSEVIPFEAGTTNFTMPAANVVVEASFYKLPYHVTYNANAPQDLGDGQAAPTDSKDYTDDDNQVTVKEATLTCEDYDFVGWTIGSEGEVVYKAGDTFEISANTTLYGKWEEKTYTVTLIAPDNGSYVIKDANDNPLNDGNYASFEVTNGTVLKYTYSPADGYKFRNWQVNDGTTHTYTSNLSYTINRKDITIEGNFDKIDYKKVYFSVNGTVQNPDGTAVEVGTVINFPADPSAIDGHPFMGWSATTVSSQSTAPTMVNKTNTKMGANDVTYYAVFGEGMAATFAASDITNTPAVAGENLSWKDSETNIKLHLSAGSRYTSGTPNTFTVKGGESNYFEITAPATLSKIVTVVSTTTYKIGSVSTGASLASLSTTQTITFTSAMNSVRCYATTSQIRATSITVECISSYSTSVKTLDHITVTGDVTNKSYTAGQSLNPAGLVVTAYYTDSTNEPVSPQGWSFDPATLSVGTTSCTATADYGGKTASKEISGLTVNEVEPQAPSFTTQPSASATYSQNATATALNVEATGNPRPSLQWYSNSTNSNAGGSAIQGATGASYTPSTTTVGTTYYYCVATNSEGSAASNVSKIEVTGGAQTGTLETMATSGDIVKNIITFKTAKNSGTSNPAVNSGQLRLYQCSSADVSNGTRGGSITIEASSGHKIKKITITNANSNDCDGGTVAYQVNGAGSWSGSATVNKNTTYSTGDNLDASSVEIACFGTTKSNRLYITKIKVEYY